MKRSEKLFLLYGVSIYYTHEASLLHTALYLALHQLTALPPVCTLGFTG